MLPRDELDRRRDLLVPRLESPGVVAFGALAGPLLEFREDPLGELPEGADARARGAWETKVASAIQLISRKHQLKPRDVKAIWLAGNDEGSSDTP